MPSAIRLSQHGGPEVMQWVEHEPGEPRPGELRVRHHAIGLNFIDVYHRTGLYPVPLPHGLGLEGAGVVEAIGAGVEAFHIGDRIAYSGPPPGSYSEVRLLPAHEAVSLPIDIDFEQAAAMMLKGMTAEYLLRRCYVVRPGDVILFHAAAGGVGLLACQWARHLGAIVIGTVGNAQKAELALQHGCHHIIDYSKENVVERVQELTGGQGVPVVYDGVGQATFEISLNCLQPRGLLVSFGNASGPVPEFSPALLSAKGSLYFTRPTLMTYNAKRHDLLASAAALFDVVANGAISIPIRQRWPLCEAAEAHRALEARQTTGCSILQPIA